MGKFFELLFTGELKELITYIGYPGVWGIIFAESGLLIGFFLPGDSLIFTAGLMSSPYLGDKQLFNIWTMVLGAWVAAIVGDNVGYEFGKRMGRNLFLREKSVLFNPANLIKAQMFYEKHGGKAIVLARFMPIVRTFAPIVAGISHMDHKRFTLYNAIGGTIWTWVLGFGGYFLGNLIGEDVDKYLLPIIVLIVLVSVLPPIFHLYKENKKSWDQKAIDYLKAIRYRFFK